MARGQSVVVNSPRVGGIGPTSTRPCRLPVLDSTTDGWLRNLETYSQNGYCKRFVVCVCVPYRDAVFLSHEY